MLDSRSGLNYFPNAGDLTLRVRVRVVRGPAACARAVGSMGWLTARNSGGAAQVSMAAAQ